MRITLLALTLFALGPPSFAHAQNLDTVIPGTAVGLTVDRFSLEDESYPTVTFHVSSTKERGLTPEFGLGFFPTLMAEGGILTNVDLGAAWNVSLPHATLLLRGGVSGLFAFDGNNAAALPAFHYGASLLLRAEGRIGLRIDVLKRQYAFYPGVSSFTAGIGFSLFPHR